MRFRGTIAAGSVAFILLAGGAVPTVAQSAQIGALSVTQAWTRATPPKARTAGGFVTIENTGTEPDRLVGAASPIADLVEIHEMRMDNGTMIMRPAGGGIEIPAGGKATLAPGGTHIMFMGLKSGLVEGDTIPVVLSFALAGDIEVLFPVEAIGTRAPTADVEGSNGQMNMQEGPHMHGHGQ